MVAARNSVVARRIGGSTVLSEARATSPLRLVSPRFAGTSSACVCLVTFGGGLLDGDAIDVSLSVEEGATLVAFTQASTKVFRGAARQTLTADVRGTLVFLPHAVSCFEGARYTQRIDVRLAGGGSCVLLDAFTSGRPAYGERWAMEALDLCTTVRRDDRTLVRDGLVLDEDVAARASPYDAFGTLVAIGPAARAVADGVLASPVVSAGLVAAPSSLACGEGAICRIAARTPEALFAEARRRLRNLPDIDAVDPFPPS
ncbi:MAG TPA: urease accessory protein UreD [Polyangiaceae bacterium]